MIMSEIQNQSYQGSEHTFSNHSFKSYQNKVNVREECGFCRAKPIILKQLQALRQAVLMKNQKIKELEGFIHKISKMAFTTSTDATDHHFNSAKPPNQSLPFQELTFAQGSVSPKNPSNINSFAQEESMEASLKHSLGNSQISMSEKELIKNSIKQQVKKLNVQKREKELPKPVTIEYPKQSQLRAKLLSIMNLLPESQYDSKMQSFQTESEPMGEGMVGLVNSKVSNHKIVKHAGFIKKSDAVDQSQSLGSTYKSENLRRAHQSQKNE